MPANHPSLPDNDAELEAGTPPHEKNPLYPPLAVWKLAILLVLTLSLYSLFWMYRTARDLEAGGRGPRRAWLWFLSPLIAIVYGFAVTRMATAIDAWVEDSDIGETRRSNPAMLGFVAFAGSAIYGASLRINMPMWVLALALGAAIVPLLLLQMQLNAIKASGSFDYRSPAWRYTWPQRIAMGALALLWVVNLSVLAQYWLAERAGTPLAAGDVIEGGSGNFALRVPTDGWVRIEPGLNAEDADIELLLAGTDDWAAIFYAPDTRLDDLADAHTEWVTDWYSENAQCAETQTMGEDTSQVIGRVSCTGVSLAHGNFVVLSHAISDGRRTVRLVVEISDASERVFDGRRSLTSLASGLELK